MLYYLQKIYYLLQSECTHCGFKDGYKICTDDLVNGQ